MTTKKGQAMMGQAMVGVVEGTIMRRPPRHDVSSRADGKQREGEPTGAHTCTRESDRRHATCRTSQAGLARTSCIIPIAAILLSSLGGGVRKRKAELLVFALRLGRKIKCHQP